MAIKTINREITPAQANLLDSFPHHEAEIFQDDMLEIITAAALVNQDRSVKTHAEAYKYAV